MTASNTDDGRALARVFELIARLRAPDGCPWDRAQRLEDVLSDLIEEAYELEWAGTRRGSAELLDEFGDVVFLVCFAIAIQRETDPSFTLAALADYAHDKIKSRHPHVFGDAKAATADESIVHWERIKSEEREKKGAGVLDGVAGNLPPLRHAVKIQERAGAVGFDWDDAAGTIDKLREEVAELEAALHAGDRAHVEDEMGDVLFAAANVGRFLKVDTDDVLRKSTVKFIRRFQLMEAMIRDDGRRFQDMTLTEMNAYWERAKAA
ncbi:MAG TPA: nucleoside triphosphate pyrophosphohydrolase [Candidatus Krumholzibacteria bacterium]|nr:nucleoside triphosphate pyrophosphohydrolase [Candidatus Krumholzibacteria bacterium]